ncbi:M24 family metallopeptidase [Cupriavidus basilensis]
MSIHIKNADDICPMRVACRLASEVLDYITPFVKPGVTTGELDRLCHAYMRDVQGTVPAPLNYAPPGLHPLPWRDLHLGQRRDLPRHPGRASVLKSGDAVNLDITVITKEGYYGDTSRMFVAGEGVDPGQAPGRRSRSSACGKRIAQVRPGARLGDIGHVIQVHAEAAGYTVVREYCGHGIGKNFHEDPQILHYGRPGTGMEMQAGDDLHDRADGQRRQARHPHHARPLDRQDARPQPVGAVGAHHPGDRNRP